MPREDETEEVSASKYLTFALGDVGYALNIATVTEIIGMQRITPVPDVPNYVKGVINLRGKVIPVMDVRARFNLEAQAYHNRTCIIVIEVRDSCVGLVVDAVSEVFDIADSEIEPPPQIGGGTTSRAISGLGKVGDDVKLILDPTMLLDVDTRSLVSDVA